MTMTRRQAREWAVQMLTAADLNPTEDPAALIASFWAQLPTLEEDDGGSKPPHGGLKKFCETMVTGVLEHVKEIDAEIVPLLENWDLYRLGTVERTVLRACFWELKYTDVPTAIAVNEAVDLVNWFSTPKSRSFVNGVLSQYAKKLGR